VKLRTKVTKGAGSKKAALAMAYKLLDAAPQRRRRFNGHELISEVLAGATLKDGIKVSDDDTTTTDERSPPDASPSHPQLLTIAPAVRAKRVSGPITAEARARPNADLCECSGRVA